MTIEVTSCGGCPFIKEDSMESDYCGHPKSSVEEHEMPTYDDKYNGTEFIPSKCPLLLSHTLIRKADNARIR